MPTTPELPTFFRHNHAVVNVLPDDAEMTWGIWDLDGWVGSIHADGDRWTSQVAPADTTLGPYGSWEDAVAGLLENRPEFQG